jgi:hypothetical protein
MAPQDYGEKSIGFIEATTGLIFEPRATTSILLDRDNPPYSLAMIFAMLLTIFVPILAQRLKYGTQFEHAQPALAFLVVILTSFCVFLIIEEIFLLLIGIKIPMKYLVAIVSYCLAPLMFAIWIIYFFDYAYNESLTIVTYLMNGSVELKKGFIKAIPYALGIVQVLVYLVFFHSLRAISGMFAFTAAIVGVLSLIPLYLSFALGIFIGNIVQPGTTDIFLSFLTG